MLSLRLQPAVAVHRHGGRRTQRGNYVLGISRDTVFVKIDTFQFAFSRDSQQAHRVRRVHHDHGNGEGGNHRDRAANQLGEQDLRPATVKETLQRRGVID